MSDSKVIQVPFAVTDNEDTTNISYSKASFEKIYNDYHLMIFRSAYLMVGNRADAEDIMQETFIAAFNNINSLKNPASLKSWLYRIMTNLVIKNRRRISKEFPSEDTAEIADNAVFQDSAEDVTENLLNHIDLKRCISELSPKCREVLVLYYYSGFKVKEIADICGCFEGTVKSRLNRGRRELKEKIKEYEK